MLGLHLTTTQLQRLCGIEEDACKAALDELVAEKFLRLNEDGTCARATDGPVGRPFFATARVDADLEPAS
jgi:hypothetical protein